jgi:hypothetical protein
MKKIKQPLMTKLQVLYDNSDHNDYLSSGLINRALRLNYSISTITRQNYLYFYKYEFYLYQLLLKRQFFNVYRKYIQLWPYHYNIMPFFKLTKQIYLKDTIFYPLIDKELNAKTMLLTHRVFEYKGVQKNSTFYYKKKLLGGLNYMLIPNNYSFLTQTLSHKYALKHYEPYKGAAFFKNFIIFDDVFFKGIRNIYIYMFDFMFTVFMKSVLELYKFYMMATILSI